MSTWECPRCKQELSLYNTYCEYCHFEDKAIVYNPDKYYVKDVFVNNIQYRSEETMTPQEELFSQLFNHEKALVKDMDTLSLRAHREELAKIAFEARARLTAVDDEEKVRKPKTTDKGFSRSVNSDDTASEAINTIKDRQKRLSKQEKLIEGLMKLGYSQADAEKKLSAGTLLKQIQDSEKLKGTVTIKSEQEKEQPKLVFNPFENKEK